MRASLRTPTWLRSLHAKLMVSLVVLVTLVAGSSATVLLEHARTRRIVEVNDRASRIADLFGQSLADPLWNVDRDEIVRQLKALSPNPEVVRFTVTATSYGVIADVSNAPQPSAEDTVVRVQPIEFTPQGDAPRERIGEVRVVLTKAVTERNFAAARTAVLATLALMLAVLYISTFLLIRHLVHQPIARLEEMVDRIASGDLDARCVVESGDELGRLAARVNVMAARLQESLLSLTRHRDELEQEVRERVRTERELVDSREKLRQLSAHQESIREEERKQIAMTIHDELGQLLTAIKMDVSLLRLLLTQGAGWAGKIGEMGELVERTLRIVRNVASHLRPAALNFGLVSALEWLVEDFSRHNAIACRFRLEGREPVLPDDRATAVFRIAQEALTNVSRHANASNVDVVLRGAQDRFDITISDDGIGFDVTRAGKGGSYGLQGMRERARMIGAHLEIASEEERGCTVRVAYGNTVEHAGSAIGSDQES